MLLLCPDGTGVGPDQPLASRVLGACRALGRYRGMASNSVPLVFTLSPGSADGVAGEGATLRGASLGSLLGDHPGDGSVVPGWRELLPTTVLCGRTHQPRVTNEDTETTVATEPP